MHLTKNCLRHLALAFVMFFVSACGGGGGGGGGGKGGSGPGPVPPIEIAVGIAQHPADASVTVGGRATFAVIASGTGPFTYQWLVGGVPIPNATAATYQTPATVLADSGARYSVQVSDPKASVTSNQAILTVSAPPGVSVLYFPFFEGQTIDGDVGVGVVPAAGGPAVPLLAPGQGTLLNMFVEGVGSNGSFGNFHVRNLLFSQNQRLYRQDLVGTAGLAAPVQVSSLALAGLCDGGSTAYSDSSFLYGGDAVDSLKSWSVFSSPGPDGNCHTEDDNFIAVRMNMAAADAPLAIARPVTTIHAPNGALTGWLLRQGQQMQRVNADFANPIADFTLPAADMAVDEGGIAFNILIFSSGNTVYAADLNTPAPASPVPVTDLGEGEWLADTLQIDAQTMLIAIGGANTTRIVRYAVASKTSSALGTLPGTGGRLLATPTRVVMSGGTGSLLALPLAGGQDQVIFVSTDQYIAERGHGGERIWLESGNAVVSVNSDGSGIQTLSGAQIAGCVHAPAAAMSNQACDAIVVVQGGSVRAYDSATGALRVTYGNVSLPQAPLTSNVSLRDLAVWGQGAVLTQVVFSPTDAAQSTVVSYYINSDQPGITPLGLP
jgi:hypothetical protein